MLNNNEIILVTHLLISFDVICLNIVGCSKRVVARTMNIFNDLAIRPEYFHTSRHILLHILFVIHNAIGLEKFQE